MTCCPACGFATLVKTPPVSLDGIKLRRQHRRLLAMLSSRWGRVVEYSDLAAKAWDDDREPENIYHALQVRISQIRKAAREANLPIEIENVTDVGYRIRSTAA